MVRHSVKVEEFNAERPLGSRTILTSGLVVEVTVRRRISYKGALSSS